MRKLMVINPNSSAAVTQSIVRSLESFSSEKVDIHCVRLEEGPIGIESQQDIDCVVLPLLKKIKELESEFDAFVIACYSDPGLYAARESISKSVFGVAQSALMFASTLGERIGVISIKQASVSRHMAYARSLQIDRAIVGDLAVGLTVEELQDDIIAADKMINTGRRLVEGFGANVIVMGCSGMARHRKKLEKALGIPVVDPTQAAVGMAITALLGDYRTMPR